jgi:hypothetical protein
MDEIKNLWSDVRGPYFADYSKQTVFDPKVHKRYNAKHYYQVDAENLCCGVYALIQPVIDRRTRRSRSRTQIDRIQTKKLTVISSRLLSQFSRESPWKAILPVLISQKSWRNKLNGMVPFYLSQLIIRQFSCINLLKSEMVCEVFAGKG